MTTRPALTDQEGTPAGVTRVTKETESCVKVIILQLYEAENSFSKYSELYLTF